MSAALAPAGALFARHNWNRWVVDCGNCTSALAVPPGLPKTQCWDCGFAMGPIVWPADPAAIEAILAVRPDPNTRSWEPGETLQQLLEENAQHGICPDEWLALSEANGGQLLLMSTENERVTGGLLLSAIEAAPYRREIGA